jgi:HAMP domain-containing protein
VPQQAGVGRGNSGDEEERRRRRPPGNFGSGSAPDPTTEYYGEPGVVSRTQTALGLVEKATNGKLPAPLAYSLSTVDLNDRQLRKAARLAARDLDLAPSFLWGEEQIAKMTDPLYGGPMRMSTLNRIMEGFEPALLQGMLPNLLGDKEAPLRPGTTVPHRGEFSPRIQPKAVVKAVRATASLADDYDMTAAEGLAFAVGIARDKANPDLVASNMQAIQRYDKAFSRDQVVGIALAATKAGLKFDSVESIVAFISPRAVQKSVEADQKIEDLQLMYGEDWEAMVPADLVEERRAAAEKASAAVDLETYARQGKNYFDDASVIEDELRADEQAWANSFVGRNLNSALDKWNRAYTNIERGIISISTPIIGAGAEIGLVDITDDKFADSWQGAFEWRNQRYKDFAEGQHLGRQFVEDTGAPEWLAAPIDFTLGWFLDPLSIVGRAANVVRAGRVAPKLLDKTTLARSLLSKTGLPVSPGRKMGSMPAYLKAVDQEAFSTSGRFAHGEYLWRSFLKGEDDYIKKVSTRFVNHFEARTAYDLPFMTALGRNIRKGLEDGSLTRIQARQEFGIGIMAQRGISVRSDSIAAQVMGARAAADESVFKAFASRSQGLQQRLFDPSDSGILTPDATYADIADDVIMDATNPISARLEVPTRLKPVPGLGISRYTGRAMKEADNRLARTAAAPFEVPAGNFLKMHQDPPNQFEKVMRDWGSGTFAASEIRAIKADISAAVQQGGFEQKLIQKLDDLNRDGLTRYATTRGIPKDMVDSLVKEVNNTQFSFNKKRVFGVDTTSSTTTTIDRPLLETQLVNEYFFVNPHDAKQLVDRYTSSVFNLKSVYHTIPGASRAIDEARRLAENAALAAGKTADEQAAAGNAAAKKVAEKEFRAMSVPGIYAKFDKGGEIMRAVTRTWKFTAVPRPGYIGRVILGDENMRFLATTGSLFERAAATHLDDATSALMRGFVTVPGVATTPKSVARLAGKAVDAPAGRVLDKLYPNYVDEIVAPDGSITRLVAERPGRWDYEPLANSTWRETEIMDDVIRETQSSMTLARSEHFGKITHGDPQYYQYWAHNLKNQLGYSIPGTVALKSVAAGDSIAQTADALRAWGIDNRAMLLQRLGTTNVDKWSDQLAKLTHSYTMGEKQIALAAASRSDNLQDLLRLPDWNDPPPIHGPLLESLTGGGSGFTLKRYVDYWYDVFVRQPENILNRQPYYAVWKGRAERAFKELHSGPLDEAALKGIDNASREFALAQVKRIMFDFSENTRLGEAIGAIVPFLQPFLEQYSVWGHILVHRNPALAGYAHQLGRLGVETGFLRNDPTTGELMVPTSWWMEQSLLYNWVTDTKGTATFTPLSSLNLFFSTTMKTPTRGAMGAIFGGAEIPLPGLSPWAGAVLREAFKDTKNQQLVSYLFAWGPNTPILPGSWSKLLQAIEPDLYEPGLLAAYEKRLATEYQDSGLLEQWQAELSEDKDPREVAQIIEERIQGKARQMLALNGFMQMFQLGATKVDLSVSQKEREFIAMLEAEGDFLVASEKFMEKYPNNSLVPTGTTTPSTAMRDLQGNLIFNNEDQPITIGYRLPASELAQRLINEDPEMRKTFNQFPELFGGLLLSLDPELANKYDPSIGAQIIRDGLVEQKTLGKFLADGEASGPEGFWEATELIEDAFEKETAGKDEDSLAYDEAKARKERAYLHVWSQFPWYAPTRLEEIVVDDEVVGARFAYGGEDPTSPRVVAKLRAFGQISGLQEFGLTKAINTYFDGNETVMGRDEIKAEMGRLGIGAIDTASAEDAGLTEQYDALKALVEEEFPEGAYVILNLLDEDLKNIGNTADRTLRTWKKAGDERYAAFTVYDAEYQKIYNTKIDGQRDWESLRTFVNDTMNTAQGRKLVQLRFERMSYSDQQAARQSLVSLPVTFYSRWDFHLSGIDLKNPEAKAFAEVQAFQNEEFARRDAADARNQVYSINYDKINQMARKALDKHPGLDPVFQAVNTWGWALRNQELADQPGKLGHAWDKIFKAVDYSQKDTEKYDLHGYTRYVSNEDLTYWRSHQAWLKSVVNRYKEQVPSFRRQWEEMDDGYFSGSLYDLLMPDTFFELGVPRSYGQDSGQNAGLAHLGGRKLQTDPKTGVTLARKPLDSLQQAQAQLGLPVLSKIGEHGDYRTRSDQAYMASGGATPGLPVASPGTSDHERGTAVDIDSSFLAAHPELKRWLTENGWYNLPNDPPHWVYRGGV